MLGDCKARLPSVHGTQCAQTQGWCQDTQGPVEGTLQPPSGAQALQTVSFLLIPFISADKTLLFFPFVPSPALGVDLGSGDIAGWELSESSRIKEKFFCEAFVEFGTF